MRAPPPRVACCIADFSLSRFSLSFPLLFHNCQFTPSHYPCLLLSRVFVLTIVGLAVAAWVGERERGTVEMAHRMAAAAMAVAVVLTALAPWPVAPTSPGPHITDLNVLLPPRMTHSVEYRLQGSGGCFAWYYLSLRSNSSLDPAQPPRSSTLQLIFFLFNLFQFTAASVLRFLEAR